MSPLKVFSTLRNHWKKSLFALGAVSYGVSYSTEKYKISQLMREYCEEAAKYGDVTINAAVPPRRILVILNPAANKRSAEKTFGKYCEPILHLGGFLVDVVKTDSEGHAARYIEELEQLPDGILVAGGDGTASETVTGLMRRTSRKTCPLGILPLGRTNSVATKLHNFPLSGTNLDEVKCLADSTISVVRGKTKKKNIMKIQPLDKNGESEVKPIFALGSLHWGAFRDITSLRDKYWYVGPLREYAASLFNAFDSALTWNCKAKIIYTPPCSGCSNCFVKSDEQLLVTGRWWGRFIPKFKLGQQAQSAPDFSHVINENCTKAGSIEISPSEVILSASDDDSDLPRLTVEVEVPMESAFDFIKESWQRIRTKESKTSRAVEGRTIELIPEQISSEDKEIYYSIDSEAYEVRPVKVSVVPKAIEVFTK